MDDLNRHLRELLQDPEFEKAWQEGEQEYREEKRQIKTYAVEGELDRFLDTPDNHEELVSKSEAYRNVKYPVKSTRLPEGEWLAEHPDLPGCKIHGSTQKEAIANLEEVKLSWIYAAMAEGRNIPKPRTGKQ
ncbi:MAG: type II toxin-antitoxin system HicB family antitoxin [Firmicutes bacterium]|nr:type II toxin-antitoxin system HicB family antitoxin [Bacillota bacterium]